MVSARLGVAALLLAGCDSVFGLREITLPTDAPPEACPADYIAIVNGSTRYRFGDTKTQWPLAAADCRDDSITGITHLVVFDGAVELAAVRAAVPLLEPWAILVGYARDTGSDPYVFRAVTGGVLDRTSSLWDPGEPNGAPPNPEETVVYISNGNDLFDAPVSWSDGPNQYFCECDGIAATEVFDVE